jgi:ribose 5-phosphate isomerase B
MVSEDEVRRLVRRALDEVGGGAAGAGRGASGVAEPAPGGGAAVTDLPTGTIALGADHGGVALKEMLVAHLRGRGFAVRDCGTSGTEPVDYPDFAHAVARLVADGACVAGIVVDGAGIGSCMAANKVPGVRAALCYDLSTARNSREHNHANVLTLGAGLIGEALARQIVDAWLATPWGADRHARRVEKITAIERRYRAAGGEGAPALALAGEEKR